MFLSQYWFNTFYSFAKTAYRGFLSLNVANDIVWPQCRLSSILYEIEHVVIILSYNGTEQLISKYELNILTHTLQVLFVEELSRTTGSPSYEVAIANNTATHKNRMKTSIRLLMIWMMGAIPQESPDHKYVYRTLTDRRNGRWRELIEENRVRKETNLINLQERFPFNWH